MNRFLEAEWLDVLPAQDPRACGSRRDLRRLNWWMRHARVMANSLRPFKAKLSTPNVTELGAGDGTFLLTVARSLGVDWSGTHAVLLDRQTAVGEGTLRAFRLAGWHAEPKTCDVFDWCLEPSRIHCSIVLANLFLHHFDSKQLAELLKRVTTQSQIFVALEPRRSALSLLFSKMLWLIGCNAVTRHDAPASVRAGFRGSELSRLWPTTSGWIIRERLSGPFSHLFVAHRTNVMPGFGKDGPPGSSRCEELSQRKAEFAQPAAVRSTG